MMYKMGMGYILSLFYSIDACSGQNRTLITTLPKSSLLSKLFPEMSNPHDIRKSWFVLVLTGFCMELE